MAVVMRVLAVLKHRDRVWRNRNETSEAVGVVTARLKANPANWLDSSIN